MRRCEFCEDILPFLLTTQIGEETYQLCEECFRVEQKEPTFHEEEDE